MSDDDLGPGPRGPVPPGEGPPGEPVGSVGEEAAKLFTALSGMTKDWAAAAGDAAQDQDGQGTGATAGAGFAFVDLFKGVSDHIATGGADCKYCPVCQVISAVRSTSPEVRSHLAVAASSLMHAAAGVLATQVPTDGAKPGPVEKINLDDGWEDE